ALYGGSTTTKNHQAREDQDDISLAFIAKPQCYHYMRVALEPKRYRAMGGYHHGFEIGAARD
ncbi:hypothetical protein ACJX0J_006484, partial [Zea mays]